jgi:hypothetical protein
MIYVRMNRFTPIATVAFTYLTLASTAFAQTQGGINLTPGRPSQGINPGTDPRIIITNAITIVFVVAILLVLAYLIFGAFKWITSGGDKDAIKGARGMIVNALIGLAVLALAFVIARVVGAILGIDFANLTLPRLDSGPVPPPAIPSNQTGTPRTP